MAHHAQRERPSELAQFVAASCSTSPAATAETYGLPAHPSVLARRTHGLIHIVLFDILDRDDPRARIRGDAGAGAGSCDLYAGCRIACVSSALVDVDREAT
jgi:hypothetical protein